MRETSFTLLTEASRFSREIRLYLAFNCTTSIFNSSIFFPVNEKPWSVTSAELHGFVIARSLRPLIKCFETTLPNVPQSSHMIGPFKLSITCFQDQSDRNSSNSFLIEGKEVTTWVDAGWSSKAKIPEQFIGQFERATKIATHFHYDHIRQWPSTKNIDLSNEQSGFCRDLMCDLSVFETIKKLNPFSVSKIFAIGKLDPSIQVTPIQCRGHSSSDLCFLDKKSKILFLGDLFYAGPVYYFLPKGSLDFAYVSLKKALELPTWDHVTISHGKCLMPRSDVESYARELGNIIKGNGVWQWNFDFKIPLWEYVLKMGSIIVRPFST